MPKIQSILFNRRFIFSLALGVVLSCGLYGCLYARGGHKDAWPNASGVVVPGKGYTIYAAGDVADCRKDNPPISAAAKTAALIASRLANDPESAALVLGDSTYPVGRMEEFSNCYQPTWGQFKARTYPSPGNHEYYTPGAIGYFGYFGEAARQGGRSYYSLELGKWHVISLDSNLKSDEYTAQLAWLKADLDQRKTLCTLAFWHHPVFSSGGHGNDDRMKDAWRMLHAANADVVLSGHDHDYERFAPQDADGRRDEARGIREFVVGTGGAQLTSFGLRKSNSAVSDNRAHGVLRMVLKETGYEWEFLPVSGGFVSDRGAALCH
jgi:hypothetical protein